MRCKQHAAKRYVLGAVLVSLGSLYGCVASTEPSSTEDARSVSHEPKATQSRLALLLSVRGLKLCALGWSIIGAFDPMMLGTDDEQDRPDVRNLPCSELEHRVSRIEGAMFINVTPSYRCGGSFVVNTNVTHQPAALSKVGIQSKVLTSNNGPKVVGVTGLGFKNLTPILALVKSSDVWNAEVIDGFHSYYPDQSEDRSFCQLKRTEKSSLSVPK